MERSRREKTHVVCMVTSERRKARTTGTRKLQWKKIAETSMAMLSTEQMSRSRACGISKTWDRFDQCWKPFMAGNRRKLGRSFKTFIQDTQLREFTQDVHSGRSFRAFIQGAHSGRSLYSRGFPLSIIRHIQLYAATAHRLD